MKSLDSSTFKMKNLITIAIMLLFITTAYAQTDSAGTKPIQ
jgi:hypothetical protein